MGQAKHKAFKGSAAQKEKEAAAKKKEGEEGEEAPQEEEEEQQEADIDILLVEDVNDVGTGDPLYKDFTFEDWALLQIRLELYLLHIAFKKDVDDPERPGVPEQHLPFYYNKYFRKQLTPKYFGVGTNTELTTLIKDTVTWNDESKVMTTPQPEDLDGSDIFVRLTEENRRERQRRIDAGDETARLKFSPLAMSQPAASKPVGSVAAAKPAANPKQWPATSGGKGALYPQTGFRNPGAAAWPGAWPGGGKW